MTTPSRLLSADREREDGERFREEEGVAFLARKHDGKNPYTSKGEAKRIAAMTTSTFGGRRKMAYRCPVCDQWHVGTDSR